MKNLAIGSLVTLFLSQGIDNPPSQTDALVIGVTPAPPPAEGEDPAPPALNLAYFRPERNLVLGSPNWRDAFDRVTSVQHSSHQEVTDQKAGHWWEEKQEDDEELLRLNEKLVRGHSQYEEDLQAAEAKISSLELENNQLRAELAAGAPKDQAQPDPSQDNVGTNPEPAPAQADAASTT